MAAESAAAWAVMAARGAESKREWAAAAAETEAEVALAADAIQDDLVCERLCETARMGSESTFDQVWKFLKEEEVGTFGLYGMAGVGKSRLLKKINNELGRAKCDFVVIWVSVDRYLNLEDIQETIAKRIGLFNESWTSKSLKDKASCIDEVLSRRKFALLLDDIWEPVHLIKAGVPRPSENKSKVVFTTRFVEVCGQMEADEQLKVECLTDEEAWELFASKIGDVTLQSHHQIPDLARTLAKECGGLPLALVNIAQQMALKRTPQEWEWAIGILRRSAYKFPGMEDEVFPVLKSSYDRLISDTIRSCFEYCSLFPQDHIFSRRDLIDYWFNCGLLDEKNGSKNDGYRIFGLLVSACLLEVVENDRVKMHNVIRNMVLSENFFVQAGSELTEMPDTEEWQAVKWMSVMDNRIENVTGIPTCPDLITLFLNSNLLKSIGDGFFRDMKNLKVLNLSNNPDLTALPIEIARLVGLQYLDVSKTGLKELSNELRSLLQLKCLNLEHTYQLTIPQQLISVFLNLQVLRMLGCGSSSTDAKILEQELPLLKCLITLTITLKSSHDFKVFFSSKKLQSCTQSLWLKSIPDQKCFKARSADFKVLDALYISDCKCLEEFQIDSALEVMSIREACGFRCLQTVNISGCFELRDLTWLILAPELKAIVISCCSNLTEIINVETLCDIIPFSKLESLELQKLENLHSIYFNPLPLQYLQKMKVIGCPGLKTLPLDSSSAQEGRIVIVGEQQWWQDLVWEDEATQNAFSPCFIASW